jgi:hypothetical protein
MELTRGKEFVTVVGGGELLLIRVLSKEDISRLNSGSLIRQLKHSSSKLCLAYGNILGLFGLLVPLTIFDNGVHIDLVGWLEDYSIPLSVFVFTGFIEDDFDFGLSRQLEWGR